METSKSENFDSAQKAKVFDKEGFNEKIKEVIRKFNIDIERLKEEQIRLAKTLQLKNAVDFNEITTMGGCDNAYIGNQIISAVVVVDKDMNVLEEKFAMQNLKFPYIPGFLAYREMPVMLECYNKIENSPDVLIIDGNGIMHPRGLGLASHVGLAISKPTIGIARKLLFGEIKNSRVYEGKKIIGECVITKGGSNPLFVSQGNMISLENAVKIVKNCIREPHKLPEPLMLAHKYADRIRDVFAEKTI